MQIVHRVPSQTGIPRHELFQHAGVSIRRHEHVVVLAREERVDPLARLRQPDGDREYSGMSPDPEKLVQDAPGDEPGAVAAAPLLQQVPARRCSGASGLTTYSSRFVSITNTPTGHPKPGTARRDLPDPPEDAPLDSWAAAATRLRVRQPQGHGGALRPRSRSVFHHASRRDA